MYAATHRLTLRLAISSTARWVRDSWLIVGASLALLLALECSLRLIQWAIPGEAQTDVTSIEHPYASQSWYPSWKHAREEHIPGFYVEYDPYRGWWVRPGQHPGLLVLPSGYRHTVQPENGGKERGRQVFLFGGSTMWGYTARDHATIPSWVAAQLHDAGIDDVEVLNRAQSAYNLTQELATLLLELRGGARPTAVVFLDGVNEIGPVVEGGRPGEIYGQSKKRRRFVSGREDTKTLLLRLAGRPRLVKALQPVAAREPLPESNIETDCREIDEYYANLVRVGVALAREFDFKILFFWQPTLGMSSKKLGPWEAIKMSEPGTYDADMVKMERACAPGVDERLARYRGTTYFPLHGLFDEMEGDQFLDQYGHVTEQANATIAAAITEQLLPVLE